MAKPTPEERAAKIVEDFKAQVVGESPGATSADLFVTHYQGLLQRLIAEDIQSHETQPSSAKSSSKDAGKK